MSAPAYVMRAAGPGDLEDLLDRRVDRGTEHDVRVQDQRAAMVDLLPRLLTAEVRDREGRLGERGPGVEVLPDGEGAHFP